jgi:hypothetical protein
MRRWEVLLDVGLLDCCYSPSSIELLYPSNSLLQGIIGLTKSGHQHREECTKALECRVFLAGTTTRRSALKRE